jgi:hypothetical protein
MQLLTVVPDLLTAVVAHVVTLVDDVPEDKDVKAGWLAFAIFVGLILAVALLGFSLVKHLRRADAAEQAGLYDPSDKKKVDPLPVEEPTDRPADQG